MFILDNLFRDLRTLTTSVTIKYDKQAKELENVESVKNGDLYIYAMLEQDSFNTHQKFPIDVLVAAGITDLETAAEYSANKNKIPLNKRDTVVQRMRQKLVGEYVETNNYYRMLNGLPDLTDLDFIYLEPDVYIKYKIPSGTPIHEISREAIILLRSEGVLDPIILRYPNKKYLRFLGEQKIEILRARTAKNFSILKMSKNVSENFYVAFNDIYEQCREYFLSVIYVKEFGKNYDYYDNFIALCIMIMTIQRIISNTFKNGIERDFYDLGTIEMFFEAYNVPFIRDVPIEYQRILVRNLNNLLRYKSTDKVLFDVCSLLGFERINIFKYFLVKEHRLDANENPVFYYKEVDDGNGNISLVEDKEKMYNLYFQSVELRERNTALALANTTNKLDYSQITIEDPYWWEDDDLKNLLYDSEFNYVETKFLNMNIMYKMTEMLFECMYIFRMLVDKKDELVNIDIELPKLFFDRRVDIFNVVCLLCALTSKKNGFRGNILISPSKILSVLGFDFNEDIEVIRQNIRDNPELYDQEILRYLEKLTVSKPEDINLIYANIRDLHEFLVTKMSRSKNIKEYHAYKNLFTTLYVSQESTELFRMSNGNVAETFLEYLQDADQDLYNFVQGIELNKISDAVNHIIFRINMLIDELKYLYIVNDSNNSLLNAIIALVKFFKSYTTDLVSFNILYLLDSKYYNMIRLIGDMRLMEKTLLGTDQQSLPYADMVQTYTAALRDKDKFDMFFQYALSASNMFKNVVDYNETQYYSALIDNIKDRDVMVKETLLLLKINFIKKYFNIGEKLYLSGKILHKEFIELVERDVYHKILDYRMRELICRMFVMLSKVLEHDEMQTLYDNLHHISAGIYENDIIELIEEESFSANILMKNKNLIKGFFILMSKLLTMSDALNMPNKIQSISTIIDKEDIIKLIEDDSYYGNISINDKNLIKKFMYLFSGVINHDELMLLLENIRETISNITVKESTDNSEKILLQRNLYLNGLIDTNYFDDSITIKVNGIEEDMSVYDFNHIIINYMGFDKLPSNLKDRLMDTMFNIDIKSFMTLVLKTVIEKGIGVKDTFTTFLTKDKYTMSYILQLDGSTIDITTGIESLSKTNFMKQYDLIQDDRAHILKEIELKNMSFVFLGDKNKKDIVNILNKDTVEFLDKTKVFYSITLKEEDLINDITIINKQLDTEKDFYTFIDKYTKETILYATEEEELVNKLKDVQKLLHTFSIFLDSYSDLLEILKTISGAKDMLLLTDKIQLIWEL